MFIINPFRYAVSGYQPAGALLFDGSADYLTLTLGSAASSANTYVASVWLKLNETASKQVIMNVNNNSGNDYEEMSFNVTDLDYQFAISGANKTLRYTNAVYRDFTGWIHVVLSRNSTTTKWIVNGVEQSLATSSPTAGSGDVSECRERP
jgi:hypothetical protein